MFWPTVITVCFFLVVMAGTESVRRRAWKRASRLEALGDAGKDVARAVAYLATAVLVLFLLPVVAIAVALTVIMVVGHLDEVEIRGRVLHADGEPVGGARVVKTFVPQGGSDRFFEETFSAADGSFAFEGDYEYVAVTAFHDGLVSTPAHPSGDDATSLDLELGPTGSIHGTLLDAAGHPLPGVAIEVQDDAWMFHQGQSDSMARFEITGLAPGEAYVSAGGGLLRSAETDVVSGDSINLSLAPIRLTWMRVHVYEGEQPVHASVQAKPLTSPWWTTFEPCAQHGAVCLLVNPEDHRLRVDLQVGDARIPWTTVIRVPALRELDQELRVPIATLAGVVRDAFGTVAAAEVCWLAEDASERDAGVRIATCGTDGRFEVTLPVQTTRLFARLGGSRCSTTILELQPGAGQSLTFELVR